MGNGLPDTVQVHVFTEFARVCTCMSVWLETRGHCISTYRPVLTKILGKRRVSNEFFVFIVTLYSKEGRKIRWPVNQGSRQTSAKLLFMHIHCIYLIINCFGFNRCLHQRSLSQYLTRLCQYRIIHTHSHTQTRALASVKLICAIPDVHVLPCIFISVCFVPGTGVGWRELERWAGAGRDNYRYQCGRETGYMETGTPVTI